MDFFPHILSMEEKLPEHQEACSDWRTRRWCHHTLAVQVSVYYLYWYFISKVPVLNTPILVEILYHHTLDLFTFLHWLHQYLVQFYWQRQLPSTENTEKEKMSEVIHLWPSNHSNKGKKMAPDLKTGIIKRDNLLKNSKLFSNSCFKPSSPALTLC